MAVLLRPRHLWGLGRVLLVEDDFLVRETLLRMLEESGFEIMAAEDAEHALEAFEEREEPFGAAIVDLRLPGRVSGDELARGFISHGMAVVVMSADHEQLDDLQRRGTAAICLPKPFSFNQLLDCLAQSTAAAACST